MAGPDLSVFGRRRSFQDYERMQQEFDMKKLAQEQAAQVRALEARKIEKEIETGVASTDPAAIKEWNVFSKMQPDQQRQYLQMKRADQIMNLGGQMAVRAPTGGVIESYEVTPKMTETPEYQAAKSGAQEQAKIQAQMEGMPQLEAEKAVAKIKAEDLANAQIDYGSSSEKSRQMLDLLDSIETDPGLGAVVGIPNPIKGGFGIFNIRGTQAADFQAKLDQLGGKQFLEAFQTLKGGGQITQIEGEKATNAIARMQTSQSEASFKVALSELRDIVTRAANRAQEKANVSSKQTEYGSPKIGDVVDGYMYLGGDPNNEESWKTAR